MPSGGMGGSTTTVTDQNNPYTNALAKNAESAYGFSMPFLQAQVAGQKTPYSDINDLTSQRMMKYYAGRYGMQAGDPNLQEGYTQGTEGMTKPNESAMQQLMQMYGIGSPSAGGTTTTSKQNLGMMDYANIAATIAAIAKA
jgi:hypothetical protein